MNCLIENEYIRELSLQQKNTYVFPNELPNWKRILKGKNGKKGEKESWRTLLRGGFIIVNRELAYFIVGGVINAMWTLCVCMCMFVYVYIYICIYSCDDIYIYTHSREHIFIIYGLLIIYSYLVSGMILHLNGTLKGEQLCMIKLSCV